MVAIKGIAGIANDLATNDPNKALSAAQGVVLSGAVELYADMLSLSPSDGDVIRYDGSVWTNVSGSSIGDDSTSITKIRNRVDSADRKILDLIIENSYITQRRTTDSSMVIDTFINEDQTADFETSSNKPVDLMDDNTWNNNWKQRDGTPDYKNGFLRQKRQPYMLEVVDEYNLQGIGQPGKGGMSQWDSINQCYWLMTSTGNNTIGEIVKLSKNMKDGKVEVLGRYFLAAQGTWQIWTGIDSDGTTLFFVLYDANVANSSDVYSIKINSDGTLGESGYEVANGETIDLTNSIENKRVQTGVGIDIGRYIDVCIWDEDDIMVMTVDNTSTAELISVAKSDLGAGTAANQTGFWPFIGGTACGWYRSLTKYGNDLYINTNDGTDDYRFIHKFDVTTDIVSNVVISASGRWSLTRNVDSDNGVPAGITIGEHGDLLEVVSTTSNGRFISRRALKNALWAENQVNGEVAPASFDTDVPKFPDSCMIESDRYYWTADTSATANQIDVFRYDTVAGTYLHGRITPGNLWTSVCDLTTDGINIYFLLFQSPYYFVWKIAMATFIAGMGTSYNVSNTIATSAGTSLANPSSGSNTNYLFGICYNADDDILYLTNDTDDAIDTLTTDGVTWNQGVFDLPPASGNWTGIEYKNNKIYIRHTYDATEPNFVYVLNTDKSTGSAMYREHIYQDSGRDMLTGSGSRGMSWHGNDLVSIFGLTGNKHFSRMKVLEDPDVLQLHSFLTTDNVLLSNNIGCVTPITERYFEPEDFADIRDVPDMNYMAVGYGDNGFSLLHLDTFLAGRSSTGKDRRWPSDIRVQHYKEGSYNNAIGATAASIGSIIIEKDMIFAGSNIASAVSVFIDLKAGTADTFYDAYTALGTYNGTLSQRNDAIGWADTDNAELYLSTEYVNKLHARTFTKDDESDYNGELPKTFVLIGTDGGMDLLIIDWDENGNRTPVKIWNNLVNQTTYGRYANWIAPSGNMYFGEYGIAGNMGSFSIPVWDMQYDTAEAATYTANMGIGSSIMGGYVMDIAPNSRCWKTASGEWRHQLLACTMESGGGGDNVVGLVDVENEIIEQIAYYNGGSNAQFYSVDTFEDAAFTSYTGGSGPTGLGMADKLHFDDDIQTGFRNNWTQLKTQIQTVIPSMSEKMRPRFVRHPANTGSAGNQGIRYSNNHQMVTFATNQLLQFFWFPWMNNCTHESETKNLTSNPIAFNYRQNAILPE